MQFSRLASVEAAFPAEEYLAVRLEMDRANPTEEPDDYAATIRELKRQLASGPTVVAATLADRLPLHGGTLSTHRGGRSRKRGATQPSGHGRRLCALSCFGPILRALRLEPTQALREDA